MAITKVTTEVISGSAVTTPKIADNAITAAKIPDGTIATGHIADNAVTAAKIPDNVLTATMLPDNVITAVHIAQNVITVTQLADDAVEADKIADGVITTNHLNSAMISSQSAVTANSSDYVLIGDASDSNALKKALVSDFGNTTEEIQDIAGAMFTSNTETGITATYEDGDGTIDLVVGTLNQNTTGTAATVTGAAQSAITSVGTLSSLTVSGNTQSATFSAGASGSNSELLYLLGSGHTGHGASNTVSLASIGESTSGNTMGLWIGSMTNENTAVIGTRTATGNLAFQTHSGGWGERMRITYDGNVGIGTTGYGTYHTDTRVLGLGTGTTIRGAKSGGDPYTTIATNAFHDASAWKYIHSDFASGYEQYNGTHVFNVAASGSAAGTVSFIEALRIKSDASITFGTATAGGQGTARSISHRSNGYSYYTGGAEAITIGGATASESGRSTFRVSEGNNNTQLTIGGDISWVCMHNGRIKYDNSSGANGHYNLVGEVASGFKAIAFEHTNGGGEVGTIVTSASATAYNTSSDYRLKENVDYTWDATTRLKQLKPARFNWISDGSNTLLEGFLAHEVSSVVPEAVYGTKDGMTDPTLYIEGEKLPEGKSVGDIKIASVPDHQGIDQSKLVPLLVKTIQELEARITTLEG